MEIVLTISPIGLEALNRRADERTVCLPYSQNFAKSDVH